MKRLSVLLLILSGIAAVSFAQETDNIRQQGIASWYGAQFAGRPTASGEIFDPSLFTAAHKTLPFGTVLTVTNEHNKRQVTVRVNDRGPFVAARIIDLSMAAAEALDMISTGTAPVIIERAVNTTLGPAAAPATTAVSPPSGASSTAVTPVAVTTTAAPPVTPPVAATTPVASPAPSAPSPAVTAPAAPAPVTTPQAVPASAASPVDPPPAVSPETTAQPVTTQAASPYQAAPQTAAVPAPLSDAQPLGATPQPAQSPVLYPAPAARILGALPPAGSAKSYRLQVGAYRVPRNAVDAFNKLKNAGLNPAYEQNGDLYRVVLPALPAGEISSIAQTLGDSGFREALIREESGN